MIAIREGKAGDAAPVAQMISDFNIEEGSPGRITSDGVIDLCFCDRPLYKSLVAEEEGDLVGYALITHDFDTATCTWCTYMQDLYVKMDWRSRGVGRRLIAAAARSTLEEERLELHWHVRDRNLRGRAFYTLIGGKEQTAIPVELSGDALKQLANEAD